MGIIYTDRRPLNDWSLTASLAGDVLTINGAALDFGFLSEGDVYPNPDPDIFASDVTRVSGDLSVTLFRPVDAGGAPLAGMDAAVSITLDPQLVIGAADVAASELAEARSGMVLSVPQLIAGLELDGWITPAESDAWQKGSGLPAAAINLIAGLSAQEQVIARARLNRMSRAERLDPLVIALATAEGKTEAALDAFFVTYGAI